MFFEDVIEYFRSFQGESPYVGLSSIFIRFRVCNLMKVCYFCDTIEKMKSDVQMVVPFKVVCNDIDKYNIQSLTFTGGEPTLPKYRKQIVSFFNFLEKRYLKALKFLVETNGFGMIKLINELPDFIREEEILCIVWSPKFFNENMLEDNIQKYKQLIETNYSNFIIKPVVTEENAERVSCFIHALEDHDKGRVYIMPEGMTHEALSKNSRFATQFAMDHKVNVTPRMHLSYNLP